MLKLFKGMFLAVSVILTLGCGGNSPQVVTSTQHESADEGQVRRNDEPAIEGLIGTVDQTRVEETFELGFSKLEKCYANALEDVEEIEGDLEFFIKIAPDGKASQVHITSSNLGSMDAEKCMINKIEMFDFPKPGGGTAEVNYPLNLESPYDLPDPVVWGKKEITSDIDPEINDCLQGKTGVKITIYVGMGGRALSAGACATDFQNYEAATCIAQKAGSWTFKDPKKKLAKISLSF